MGKLKAKETKEEVSDFVASADKPTPKITKPASEINPPAAVAPIRVGGRMKKAKVVFDPSENYIPRKRFSNDSKSKSSTKKNSTPKPESPDKDKSKVASATSSRLNNEENDSNKLNGHKYNNELQASALNNYYSGICLICLKSGTENELLNCSVMYCNYKAHFACLNLDNSDFDLTLLQNQWQCPHCKTCVVCFENSEAGVLTICSVCEDAYHSVCHNPRINTTSNLDEWKCTHCFNMCIQYKGNKSTKSASGKNNSKSITSSPTSRNTSVDKEIKESIVNEDDNVKHTSLVSVDKIKIEITDDDFPHIPPTPPPSQSQILSLNDGDNDNTVIKDIKEEFAGFSDVESPALSNDSTPKTSNEIELSKEFENNKDNDSEPKTKDDLKRVSMNMVNKTESKKIKLEEIEENSEIVVEKSKEYTQALDIFKQEYEIFHSKNISNVPDASKWTCSEVYNYFSKYFPKEAEIFREQEIDGSSLLLMKRSDVVNGLNLKLGPALKIYRHVIRLQTKNNDPRLSWF